MKMVLLHLLEVLSVVKHEHRWMDGQTVFHSNMALR